MKLIVMKQKYDLSIYLSIEQKNLHKSSFYCLVIVAYTLVEIKNNSIELLWTFKIIGFIPYLFRNIWILFYSYMCICIQHPLFVSCHEYVYRMCYTKIQILRSDPEGKVTDHRLTALILLA